MISTVLSEGIFGDANEKQTEYLGDILESGQHLLSLINDILTLQDRGGSGWSWSLRTSTSRRRLTRSTLVRERAGRRWVTLQRTVDARLGQVRGDERKIRQVALNLLSNAIKFTPEGGRIEVTATQGDGAVEVSVSDAPEDQEAVFEEFRQVGPAATKVEGTGLGLALSRKFVDLHGGRTSVTSQVGVGSTFTFAIPMRRGE